VLSNLWLIAATAGRSDLIGMAITLVLALVVYVVRRGRVAVHFP
jgi:hypothetical protein